MLQVGIVGLPNAGKSTLFNALVKKQQALVASYPFATIEPNVGIVPVPDERLEKLAEIYHAPIIPATVRFVDIAGLVKGASQGEGLGNKFLAHIREVDLICEVVRAFDGSRDFLNDMEIIKTELELADLDTVSKLMAKKFIYVLNTNLDTDWEEVKKIQEKYPGEVCVLDAKLEADLGEFSPAERADYLYSLGIKKAGVDELIKLAYERLGLISFLTAGEKEVRAWTIKNGTKALEAAGVIHTDFMKGFIKAEAVDCADFIQYNGWKSCRQLGKTKLCGRDYEIKDGEVIEFRVNT
ncbi:YchF family ATPase [Candidatus Gottesmanbacteria bacterium]|nr:YchF family ATPase [Candidatus Gottesmanbacteria bacterium]